MTFPPLLLARCAALIFVLQYADKIGHAGTILFFGSWYEAFSFQLFWLPQAAKQGKYAFHGAYSTQSSTNPRPLKGVPQIY
jgi:hypothetical protein